MHRLLARQLKKATAADGTLDSQRLLEMIDQAYEETDHDRQRTDRSITLMIEELETLNSELREGQIYRFEAAINAMSHGLSMYDSDGRLVICNQKFLDIYRLPPEANRPGITLEEMMDLRKAVNTLPTNFEGHFATHVRAANWDNKVRTSSYILPDRRVISVTRNPMAEGGFIAIHEDITEEIRAQEQVAQQSMRFEAALENMNEGLCMFDKDERLVVCNAAYQRIYDLPPDLVEPGARHADIVAHRTAHGMKPVGGVESFMLQHWELRAGEGSKVVTVELADGRRISINHQPMLDGGWVSTHEDVTENQRRVAAIEASEREMKLQNLRFEAAVNNMSQGLCMFDKAECLVICNEPYARIYNLPPQMMKAGTTLSQILEHRFDHGMLPKEGRDAYVNGRKRLVTDHVEAKDEIEMQDGRTIAIHHHPMADGGWVATHEDVTEQRRIEARIRHLARHDALTDLPNRVLLREEMEKLEARIERDEIVAVLCLDLDHFKAVNDTLGHGIGDKVLVAVAEHLKRCARDTDVVARLGGDEFAILIHSLDGPEGAAAVAARIVSAIAEPMEIEGHHILIGTSIGIAIAPFDGHDADTLLKNADLALYRAKSDGRGTYHFFEKGMDEALQHRRMLEQGLKTALAGHEFRLMYQPLLDLGTNRVCCLEALLRWDHPVRGLISPAEFIPIAEETGVINAIGEWVLKEACKTAAGWPENVRIAVNLSPIQFKSRGLVDHVTTALAEAGLSPQRLELEVTESLLLADTELTLQTLHRLRALGVRISMDDFGTGYSSLSYLRSFPFDKIKIDRSFMSGLGPRDDTLAIIKAVIGLGQSLGMSTTAEGIETEEQLAAVREQGCDEVQGFLFSPPLPASGVAALLGKPVTQARRPHRRRA